MKVSWKIGSILGIDICVDASWLVIFGLLTWIMASYYFPGGYPDWPRWEYWAVGVLTSLLFFASVLAHELAHSLVAVKQGEKVRRITLFILGGVAQISEEPKEASKEFYMAVVGPLASFAIALVCYLLTFLLLPISEPLAATAKYLRFINILLGVFNLLPGFPMDGGRILRALIWKFTGDLKKATRIASSLGQGFAFVFIAMGFLMMFRGYFINGVWIMMIGWFLHSAAGQGYHQVIMREMLKDVRAEDLMVRQIETVPSDLSVERLVEDFILKGRERAFIVADKGKLQGIVCLEDVKKIPKDEWASTMVSQIMTPREKLVTASPRDDGNKVLARLTTRKVRQLPVVKDGKILGIVCRTDILHFMQLRSDLGI
ncbi:MAG: site-2 protease family protein [Deltaproteobacteria bacterium]|nr:site-2 protease family protein [Deltaproteobacteria bacterium]MBW2123408.1 site-2 protease family protein [Deltaproteobacteria bacterium]